MAAPEETQGSYLSVQPQEKMRHWMSKCLGLCMNPEKSDIGLSWSVLVCLSYLSVCALPFQVWQILLKKIKHSHLIIGGDKLHNKAWRWNHSALGHLGRYLFCICFLKSRCVFYFPPPLSSYSSNSSNSQFKLIPTLLCVGHHFWQRLCDSRLTLIQKSII